MSKIQFVQTTPDELENLIKESVRDELEKLKVIFQTHLNRKNPYKV